MIVGRSFRDPMSMVIATTAGIVRGIHKDVVPQFEYLLRSEFLKEFNGTHIVETWPVDDDTINTVCESFFIDRDDYPLWLGHSRLELISYVHEWGFVYLKRAAIHHLRILEDAVRNGFIIIDGSTANIQFQRGHAVFIDVGSIRRYNADEPWYGYKQFCQQFLIPMLLNCKLGICHQRIFSGNLEPIEISDFSKILPFNSWLSIPIVGHVHLNRLFKNNKLANESVTATAPKIKKHQLVALLCELRFFIETLEPKVTSHWLGYSHKNSYQYSAASSKRELIYKCIQSIAPKRVIDLGCNTGDFSLTCFNAGVGSVVGLDSDPSVIDFAVNRMDLHSKGFTGLVYDLSNIPQSEVSQGLERIPFIDRLGKFDYALCLALIHHVVIAANVPMHLFLTFLCGLSPKGVIEFIPRTDPMVAVLLKNRSSSHEYSEEFFFECLLKLVSINGIFKVDESERILVSYTIK
jgi:SAM-dependent methyltransferase